ncbi:hypothetical protein ABZ249_25335 [Nocardiopsis sp. NPDC006139]|uniref:hypothetical protein n=1 Tax=Nocardiopsis sp. NPDC006139 TaxID=3154578 RepID=UPI0033AC6A0F
MRFALHLLGTEVLAVEFASAADLRQEAEQQDEPELGPPFGFSGGSGGLFEQAYPDPDDALPTPRRVD